MNQKYFTILIVVLFAAAAFVGGYLWRGSDSAEPTPNASVSATPSAVVQPATSPAPTTVYTPVLHTISLTAAGPSPKTLSIRKSDAVRFINNAAFSVWPASDPHPEHSQCPYLDAGRGLKSGEDYTLVFSTATTCTYHSHIDPSNDTLRGTIMIR